MVAIFMGFADAVPSVRRACLQPHALLEVLSTSATTKLTLLRPHRCVGACMFNETHESVHHQHVQSRSERARAEDKVVTAFRSDVHLPSQMCLCRKASGHVCSGQRCFTEAKHI